MNGPIGWHAETYGGGAWFRCSCGTVTQTKLVIGENCQSRPICDKCREEFRKDWGEPSRSMQSVLDAAKLAFRAMEGTMEFDLTKRATLFKRGRNFYGNPTPRKRLRKMTDEDKFTRATIRRAVYGAIIGTVLTIVVIIASRVAAHARDHYYNDGNGYVTRYGPRYGDVESVYVPPPPPPIPPLPESPKSCLQTGGCWD